MNWIKTHPNFLAKLLALIIILAALAVYQNTAAGWAAEQAENEAAIAEVEAYNAEILAAQEAEAEADADASAWIDGTYSGSGDGFGGEIEVSVTIEDDVIVDITIVSADGEDDSYLETALDIVEDILSAQSTDVDTITGATFSSTGIRTAVEEALSQAVNTNG